MTRRDQQLERPVLVRGFLSGLDAWERSEVRQGAHLPEQAQKQRQQRSTARAAVLRFVASREASPGAILRCVETMFEDQYGPFVICSTVHQAKGQEADTVYLLQDTLARSLLSDNYIAPSFSTSGQRGGGDG